MNQYEQKDLPSSYSNEEHWNESNDGAWQCMLNLFLPALGNVISRMLLKKKKKGVIVSEYIVVFNRITAHTER